MECDRCWKKCVVLRTVDGLLISDTKKSPRRPFVLCKECSRYFQSKGRKVTIVKRSAADKDLDDKELELDDETDDNTDNADLLCSLIRSGGTMGAGIFEVFRGLGADVLTICSSSVNVYRSYDASRSVNAVVTGTSEAESAMVTFRGHAFMVVPTDTYEVGEISSEWCLGGAPDVLPRTVLGLRDGRWLFLSPFMSPRTGNRSTTGLVEAMMKVPERPSVP
jgi:hypothetical protein